MRKTIPRNKVIVILGPTASGKSAVAIKLAKKFNGEIISADSRQVYRGMDIGTGKVLGAWSVERGAFVSEGIPHYLIDVADPNDEFNISHFKKLAEKAIKEILRRKKVPIICGGTGFWIQSVVDNVELPEVKPDLDLRKRLEKESVEKLFAMLEKLDSERAKNIDPKNNVRIIRAIEIAKALGAVPKIENQESRIKNHEFLQIGLDVPRKVLNEKIKKRFDERFKIGMIEEVRNLNKNGVSWERLEDLGLEYRWIARYLQNKITLQETKEKLYFAIIHYAKRQMTWFSAQGRSASGGKRDKRILWLKDYKEIEKEVKEFLKK